MNFEDIIVEILSEYKLTCHRKFGAMFFCEPDSFIPFLEFKSCRLTHGFYNEIEGWRWFDTLQEAEDACILWAEYVARNGLKDYDALDIAKNATSKN